MSNPKITYHSNGKKSSEEYLFKGVYHRLDGPAYTAWYENGQKTVEIYYLKGIFHRIGGPARSSWNIYGEQLAVFYYVNNHLHREDGPACVYYDRLLKNIKIDKSFYLNGVRYNVRSFKKFKQMIKLMVFK